jgi:hypothetical protein
MAQEVLESIGLSTYVNVFHEYGIDTLEDCLALDPAILDTDAKMKPFHKKKLLDRISLLRVEQAKTK